MGFEEDVIRFFKETGIGFCRRGNDLVFCGKGIVLHLIPFVCENTGTRDCRESENASCVSSQSDVSMACIGGGESFSTINLFQDYWYRGGACLKDRLMAHLGVYEPVFARKCEVVRTDMNTVSAFYAIHHSYGPAKSKYHYALYHKGEIVAAASFSSARRMRRKILHGTGCISETDCRSYEWVRYASVSGMRVSGGMGRLFKAFVSDTDPDDVMSYADMEWSSGKIYRAMGFEDAGFKAPVDFIVDLATYCRRPVSRVDERELAAVMEKTGMASLAEISSVQGKNVLALCDEYAWIRNFGSRKYVWTNPRLHGKILFSDP